MADASKLRVGIKPDSGLIIILARGFIPLLRLNSGSCYRFVLGDFDYTRILKTGNANGS